MRNVAPGLMTLAMLVLLAGTACGADVEKKIIRVVPPRTYETNAARESSEPASYTSASVDTYTIVSYGFETSSWQGWTRVDNTQQKGTFWHVDDFAGLGGGRHGGLAPLEGTKSMWCGARPGGGYTCSWRNAPGYGNGWAQFLETGGFHFTGFVRLSYHLVVDSEPGHDILKLQIGTTWSEFCWCSDFVDVTSFSGRVDTVVTHTFHLNQAGTQIRFIFSSDAEGSDEDGLWDTDGAAILDNITVADSTGLLDFQDFESSAVGATYGGIWSGQPQVAFGKYSGLKTNLKDKDPCGENLSTQVVFFVGSPVPSSEYPGLYNSPYCTEDTNRPPVCQNEMIVSPVIDLKKYSTAKNNVQNAAIPSGELPFLGATRLRFTVYEDLPAANLVFYVWHVRSIQNGCPGLWRDRNELYCSNEKTYSRQTEDVSDLIASDSIQVAVGVVDMCRTWYPGGCGSTAHTPAPWFDNVEVQRYRTVGPQWVYYSEDLFQDNFPPDDALAGFVRADAARDINPSDNPVIRPGDSIVVRCSSPVGGGIATDAGGPRVYMHVRCKSIRYPVTPSLAGPQLQGTYGRYVSDDGTWTVIQCDSARTGGRTNGDRFMADLNDSLFTRGYMIEYYFKAYDNAGETSTLPRGADHFTAENPHFGSSYYFEFTCLPTGMANALYVDDYDGIGSFDGVVQDYFDRTLEDVVAPSSVVDRYDVLGPTSFVSNGLASRVRASQLDSVYLAIVWDSGDLSKGTITDGTPQCGDKSDDCQLLVDFLNLAPYKYYYPAGLWILGDNVAQDLSSLSSPQALALMNTCAVSLVNGSYFELTGGQGGSGVVNPLITGVSTGFVPGGVPYRFFAYGGCPGTGSFDVLGATGAGQRALKYPDYGGQQYCAAVQSQKTLPNGRLVRTMWFGFSFMSMRDRTPEAPIIRNEIVLAVLREWLAAVGPRRPNITGAGTPKAYRLAQNFPNPFNPSTTIHYDMKDKGLVTLRIYNVAGALVRTLLDEVKDAGTYSLMWDGRNNAGTAVASGIYFYKMETKGFSATKKMVILR